jgi:plastocyanin
MLLESLKGIVCLLILTAPLIAGEIKGKAQCKGSRDNRDVVVYIESTTDTAFAAPKENPVMDQKNLTFVPHVLPVVKGTTVDFLNSDDVLHNVFTPDKCAEKMNLGTWPKGEKRSFTFKEIGCQSVVLCNVHPEMEAWIVTLQNPYFAKTAKDGAYEIEYVPAGKYRLAVWHEKLKAPSVEVEIPDSGAVEVNFTLTK